MARSGFKRGTIRQFEKDVLAYANVADDFVKEDNKDKKVIRAVIEAAMSGHGPGNKPYPPYSEDYDRRKKAAAGQGKRWLRGIKQQGLHMLNRVHFKWKKVSETVINLVWRGTGKTGDYARVHNDGEGKMPKREWMHLESSEAINEVNDLIAGTLNNHAKKFNAKYGKR